MTEKPPAAADDAASIGTMFSFERYVVFRALFEELPEVSPSKISGEQSAEEPSDFPLSLSLKVGRLDAGHAEVRLRVGAQPPRKKYKVEVEVGGIFSMSENAEDRVVRDFCRTSAPMILFPFARDLVHRMTADARAGSLLLQPVNLYEAFPDKDQIAKAAAAAAPPDNPAGEARSETKATG